MKLDYDKKCFAVNCFVKYLRTLSNEGHPPPRDVDVEHSSLIFWLLDGNEPLPKPPPRRFSRPNHQLGAGEECPIGFVGDSFDSIREHDGRVVIDQCGEYEWHDKTAYIVRHIPSGDLYQISEGSHRTRYVTNSGDDNGLVMRKISQEPKP